MLNTAEHKNILLRILKDIYADPKIGPFLGFKGGTAAYFFYNLDRFSLDLDFDLLRESSLDNVLLGVEKIVSNYGKIKEKKKKKSSLLLVLSYRDDAPNIKVEINTKDFNSSYEIKSYLGISMKVMTKEDMFAHKLVAMHERSTNRDVFDVWFFSSNNWPLNEEIIKKRTGKNIDSFIEDCIEKVENIPDSRVLDGMGEVLDEKQKSWMKKNLKKEVVFNLKLINKK